MARGGYQAPRNPAPVAMPGAMSRRTDGGPADAKQVKAAMTGGEYGEATEMDEIQSGAGMSASGQLRPGAISAGRQTPAPPSFADAVPFNAASASPDEPLTSGAPFGPGTTPMPMSDSEEAMQMINPLASYMPVYRWAAEQPDASPVFRSYVRWLDAMMQVNGGG